LSVREAANGLAGDCRIATDDARWPGFPWANCHWKARSNLLISMRKWRFGGWKVVVDERQVRRDGRRMAARVGPNAATTVKLTVGPCDR
jgi:hypothetical protein